MGSVAKFLDVVAGLGKPSESTSKLGLLGLGFTTLYPVLRSSTQINDDLGKLVYVKNVKTG